MAPHPFARSGLELIAHHRDELRPSSLKPRIDPGRLQAEGRLRGVRPVSKVAQFMVSGR